MIRSPIDIPGAWSINPNGFAGAGISVSVGSRVGVAVDVNVAIGIIVAVDVAVGIGVGVSVDLGNGVGVEHPGRQGKIRHHQGIDEIEPLRFKAQSDPRNRVITVTIAVFFIRDLSPHAPINAGGRPGVMGSSVGTKLQPQL